MNMSITVTYQICQAIDWEHTMNMPAMMSESNNNRPGARLTKAYDVTIQRYCNSHAKI